MQAQIDEHVTIPYNSDNIDMALPQIPLTKTTSSPTSLFDFSDISMTDSVDCYSDCDNALASNFASQFENLKLQNEIHSQNADTASSGGSLLDFMNKVIDGRAKIDLSFDIDETFEQELYVAIA